MSLGNALPIKFPLDIELTIDSIKNSKIIDWNAILHEAQVHTEKKENSMHITSLFKDHALHSVQQIIPIKNTNSIWMLGVIIISLLLIGAVRQLNNKRLLSFFSAFFLTRFAGQLQREEYAINNRAGTALLFNFVLVFALFIFQVLDHFRMHFPDQPPFIIYLLLCGGIGIVYFLKIIFIRIVAGIFKADSEAKEYIFYILLFNQLLSIFLLPLVTGIAFIRNFDPSLMIYLGIGVIVILFIYRLLRGIFIGISKPKISKFYLFLYLCTLEFLPLLFCFKFLVKF